MLTIQDLHVYHGPIEAVHGISLTVERGKCISLLGPNGAGKTSTISAITGIARATGSILFEDREISGDSVEARIASGIAVSPEGRRIFSNLTILENLTLGAALQKDQTEKGRDIEHWFSLFPILAERRDQAAGTLSGGEQQMLAIARALMARPKILLLDEPSLGLAPKIVRRIFDLIGTLKEQGMTILLVEQNATQALKLADYAYLMSSGRIVAHGTADELGRSDKLMAELTGVA